MRPRILDVLAVLLICGLVAGLLSSAYEAIEYTISVEIYSGSVKRTGMLLGHRVKQEVLEDGLKRAQLIGYFGAGHAPYVNAATEHWVELDYKAHNILSSLGALSQDQPYWPYGPFGRKFDEEAKRKVFQSTLDTWSTRGIDAAGTYLVECIRISCVKDLKSLPALVDESELPDPETFLAEHEVTEKWTVAWQEG